MADKSKIEWTDATWNPIRGCTRVSEGCRNCYAERQAIRQAKPGEAYHGLVQITNGHPQWTGKVQIVPELQDQPLRWRKPRRIFVNSMSDLFHDQVPFQNLVGFFTVMANSHIATGRDQTHIFQILTKRPARMAEFLGKLRCQFGIAVVQIAGRGYMLNFMPYIQDGTWVSLTGHPGLRAGEWDRIPQHIWTGFSAEDQKTFDERWEHAQKVSNLGWLTWVSLEPLLGPVKLPPSALWKRSGLKWVVVGGESGPGARPMHPDWARSLCDQCTAAGIPFFFKQWGAWADFTNGVRPTTRWDQVILPDGETIGAGDGTRGLVETNWKERGAAWMNRIGKGKAGRTLDGCEWNEYPNIEKSKGASA